MAVEVLSRVEEPGVEEVVYMLEEDAVRELEDCGREERLEDAVTEADDGCLDFGSGMEGRGPDGGGCPADWP